MTEPFTKDKPILASDLNGLHQMAVRGSALPGSPGAAAAAQSTLPESSRFISVIARTANAPTALINHSYTILLPAPGGGAGDEHTINFRNIIVRYPWGLIDPSANKHLTFAPAAVVGDDEWKEQPWRARGVLHQPNGLDQFGESYFMVELYGLGPILGC